MRRALAKTASSGLALAGVLLASAQALAAAPRLTLDLGGGVTLDLVLVRAGTFTQGSPPEERGRNPDEAQRQVTISRDFYVGRFPITVGQFRRFTTESGYRTEAERGSSGGYGWDGKALVQKKEYTWQNPGFAQGDGSPVVLVTYDDALAFDDWLAKKTRLRVELPTEAQYEYSLRSGSKTRYHGGDGDDVAGKIGWFAGNAGNGTRPVGQKQANEWGLSDMAGNVWEWCRDYYSPYEPGPVTDPLVAASPSTEDKPRRVLRGGSWLKDAKNLRSAARYRNAPGSRNADNGFRIVTSTEPGAPAPVPAADRPPASDPGPPTELPSGGVLVCLALPVIGIALLVVWAVLRKKRPVTRGGRFGITWSAALDGFVILAPAHLRGQRLFYRVLAHGRWVPGAIVLEGTPAGQFVYTGATPAQVELDRIGGFQGWPPGSPAYVSSPYGSSSAYGSAIPLGSSDYQASRNDEPFHGYPSAY